MDLQVQKTGGSVALTKKGLATRQRIIEGAAAEIRAHGVAATTLDDVLARTNTSKSQLFHYFPEGKDALLIAVATYEAQQVLDDQPQLGHLTSWRAWQEWRDTVVSRYLSQGQHCPMNVLITQIGRTTPGAQAIVTGLMDKWQAELVAGIESMRRQGKVGADLDSVREGAALLAGIQGGVVVMLATGRITNLEAALDVGIARLRSSGAAG
jgi:AcrR family transcriptional regulator